MNQYLVLLSILLITLLSKNLFNHFEGFEDGINTTGSQIPQNVRFSVNWSMGASNQLVQLIRELGPPDLIDVNRGGMVMWKKSTLNQRTFCWDSVALSDTDTYPISVGYAFPLLSVRGPLEIRQALYDLIDFHPAIMFDSINQRLIVRGYTMQQAIVLLTLAKRLLSKEINLQQAKNLIRPLIDSINYQSPNYNPDIYNKFQIELCTFGLPNETNAVKYGGISPTEIYNLKSGAPEKEIRNMDIIGWSS